jgi:glycosyltransferase involved in cell wall biosynthesis
MTIEFDDFSKSSKGGTEIIKYGLLDRLPKELLSKFQIVTDRFDKLDDTKIRLYWCHLDPEQSEQILAYLGYENIKPLSNGGWNKFHKIIFISHHQKENWINRYDIPRSHCSVIKYALEPIELQEKPNDKIVFVHHSNPQRGLSLLVDVFEKLCEEYDNIELKVHSSWNIYGMNNRQSDYKKSDLYQRLEKHPKIKNIGYLSNEELKKSLASSHIFPYPNIMVETFCLSLLEAMSAGLLCVHPNYGCLPETASNWTMMYDYHEKIIPHEERFYQELKKAIKIVNQKETQEHLKKQKEYVDYLFNWDRRTKDWINLLESLKDLPLKKVNKSTSLSYQ